VAFARVIGHDHVKQLLSRALRQGRLPPALLFAGPEGIGKRTLALAAARALVCLRQDGDACGACPACSRAARGIHPDLTLVEPATAAIKIEQVRDAVRAIVDRPFEAQARAVVIDDAHVMTEQAANALLKSLEEPPATSHVFLITSAPQALPATIRSRCQVLRMGGLPTRALEGYLSTELGLSAEEARLRASLSAGSVAAALAFESKAYRELRAELLGLLEALPNWGPLERMAAAERLDQAEDPAMALTTLRSLLRDATALRSGASPDRLMNADAADRLAPLARGPLGARAASLAEAVGDTRESLRTNANRLLSLDLLLEALVG
jgi:DNA polymerase-3 subunit delta'